MIHPLHIAAMLEGALAICMELTDAGLPLHESLATDRFLVGDNCEGEHAD